MYHIIPYSPIYHNIYPISHLSIYFKGHLPSLKASPTATPVESAPPRRLCSRAYEKGDGISAGEKGDINVYVYLMST